MDQHNKKTIHVDLNGVAYKYASRGPQQMLNPLMDDLIGIIMSHRTDTVIIYKDCKNSSGEYWKHSFYPFYKINRGAGNQLLRQRVMKQISYIESGLDVEYKVGFEADDLIAYNVLNDHTDNTHIIISSDKDFFQLQNKNVYRAESILEFTQGVLIGGQPVPESDKLRFFMRGDRVDGIPNILSDDDAISNPEKKQRVLSSKLLNKYIEEGLQDKQLILRMVRNRRLMDLKLIANNYMGENNI